MRPLTWYFRPVELRDQPPVIDGADHSCTVLDISSDLETSEPIFDLRRGRACVSDLQLLSPPNGSAESLAYQSLVQGYISYDELMQLVGHLPSSDLSDRPIFNTQIQRHRAFITGACVHGGRAAIMSNFNTYPWVTRLLRSIGRQQAPTSWYSSIAINLNCQSAMHRDSNNHSVLPSAVIPASLFTGGQLWVENLSGSIVIDGVRGDALELTLPCVTFQSRRRHATLSWTGDRLVIVLYQKRQAWRLPEVSRSRLRNAGFHLYVSDVLTDPYL